MAGFLSSVGAASKKAGGALKAFVSQTARTVTQAKARVRHYRRFAKTRAAKDTITAQMATLVDGIQRDLGDALQVAEAEPQRLGGTPRSPTRG